jgi:hypothetical protein
VTIGLTFGGVVASPDETVVTDLSLPNLERPGIAANRSPIESFSEGDVPYSSPLRPAAPEAVLLLLSRERMDEMLLILRVSASFSLPATADVMPVGPPVASLLPPAADAVDPVNPVNPPTSDLARRRLTSLDAAGVGVVERRTGPSRLPPAPPLASSKPAALVSSADLGGRRPMTPPMASNMPPTPVSTLLAEDTALSIS